MARNKIEPNVIATITVNNIMNIPIVITNFTGNILHITHIEKVGYADYHIRRRLKSVLNNLISIYGVDTILIEQNQLFIDKIDRYPDPYVLRNIKLGFGIQITLEDTYWESIKYIMEIPRWEWKKEVEKLRGKISMLEYYHKNYREGKNPYTVLRKMGDVLQGYERYEDIRK